MNVSGFAPTRLLSVLLNLDCALIVLVDDILLDLMSLSFQKIFRPYGVW